MCQSILKKLDEIESEKNELIIKRPKWTCHQVDIY
jgi:hypothetical protein